MATTVIDAFNEYMAKSVNLDVNDNKTAKSSRDWLMDNIKKFPEDLLGFPKLYPQCNIFFGSHARKTKPRPLDDIDIMVGLNADSAVYDESGDKIYLTTHNELSPLKNLCHDNSNFINSRKVINKFVSALTNIPNYEKAEIGRKGEAAILRLKSYEWDYDIVPCFITSEDYNGKQFYIIPDGQGHWKKTDPRIDRDRVIDMAGKRGAGMRPAIRLIKNWNTKFGAISIPSYMLENMVLDFYTQFGFCGNYVDYEFIRIINYIKENIFSAVNDPKGMQGDLNTLSVLERVSVFMRCSNDYDKSQLASSLEKSGEQKKSIETWGEIFGTSFPKFS